jgi:hypothetical protein
MQSLTEKRFVTVGQLPEFYPAFSASSIRWLIFNERQNGFSCCIRRVGRKVLINLSEFEKWVDSQQGVNANDRF